MALFAAIVDIIVTFHSLYVAFTVGGELAILLGGLLRWDWVRNRAFRMVHLASVLLVALEASVGVLCSAPSPKGVSTARAGRAAGGTPDLLCRPPSADDHLLRFPFPGLPLRVRGFRRRGGPHVYTAATAQSEPQGLVKRQTQSIRPRKASAG